jgi:hypothetical protein
VGGCDGTDTDLQEGGLGRGGQGEEQECAIRDPCQADKCIEVCPLLHDTKYRLVTKGLFGVYGDCVAPSTKDETIYPTLEKCLDAASGYTMFRDGCVPSCGVGTGKKDWFYEVCRDDDLLGDCNNDLVNISTSNGCPVHVGGRPTRKTLVTLESLGECRRHVLGKGISDVSDSRYVRKPLESAADAAAKYFGFHGDAARGVDDLMDDISQWGERISRDPIHADVHHYVESR